MSWGEIDDVGRWRIIFAGAFGGLAASYAMNQFQRGLSNAQEALSPQQARPRPGRASDSDDGGGENATVKAAQAISQAVGCGQIPDSQKELAGTAVHYGFGAAVGAVYGVMASEVPTVTSGFGIAYGSVVWLFSDEVAVPVLGLSPAPSKSPLSTHLSALAAHCLYGFTTDLVMRGFIKKIWAKRG